VDLTDVDTGPDTGNKLCVRVVSGVAEEIAAIVPEDVTGFDRIGNGQPSINRSPADKESIRVPPACLIAICLTGW